MPDDFTDADLSEARDCLAHSLRFDRSGRATRADVMAQAAAARCGIADVGDGAVSWHAGRGREVPPHHHQLAALGGVADDWGEMVGKDARQRRQIARAVRHGAEGIADGLPAFGDEYEDAHKRERAERRGRRPWVDGGVAAATIMRILTQSPDHDRDAAVLDQNEGHLDPRSERGRLGGCMGARSTAPSRR